MNYYVPNTLTICRTRKSDKSIADRKEFNQKVNLINEASYSFIKYKHPKGRFILIETSKGVNYNFQSDKIEEALQRINNLKK